MDVAKATGFFCVSFKSKVLYLLQADGVSLKSPLSPSDRVPVAIKSINPYPTCSMYRIFTNIYHHSMAQMLGNILEYSMHRAYVYENSFMVKCLVIRQLLIFPMVPPTSATPRRCRKVTSDTEISKSQIVTDSTI